MCYMENLLRVYLAVASFAILAQLAFAQGANSTLPLIYPARVLHRDSSQTCPSEEQEEILRNEIDNETLSLLRESVILLLQNFSCGGSTGWRRVAYLNISDPSQQCPTVWREITTPFRVCGRRSASASCEGLNYTTGSEQYDQVCGRMIGYQLSSPDAFGLGVPIPPQSIDSYYMDGLSVTHGSPRQHIWSFVGGLDEVNSRFACPCIPPPTHLELRWWS